MRYDPKYRKFKIGNIFDCFDTEKTKVEKLELLFNKSTPLTLNKISSDLVNHAAYKITRNIHRKMNLEWLVDNNFIHLNTQPVFEEYQPQNTYNEKVEILFIGEHNAYL